MKPLYRTLKSPRHGFSFNAVPTKKASMYGGSLTVHYPESYGPILDCVYEMAVDIAAANAVSDESAIATVLRDEGWRVLPTHRAQILQRLAPRQAP